jgi:hypothetical protein
VQRDWRQRRLVYTVPLLWACAHVLLYAWRLPVTYQHGRYLWAALPVWIVYGLAGWNQLLQIGAPIGAPFAPRRLLRLARPVAGLTLAALLLLFLLLGAQVYSRDVAFINGEMVTVAHWLAANTPPGALIAAHDIGAIGYFAQRPLLDLAGLISPDVIPLLNDEAGLARYLLERRADYLVTAPGWPYTQIVTAVGGQELFTSDLLWTQSQGYNNMTVYQLSSP